MTRPSLVIGGAIALLSVPLRGQHVLVEFQGISGEAFGGTVAFVGDADNDGYDDLAVGADRSDVGGSDTGHVELRSGPGSALLWRIDGTTPGMRLGASISRGGDIDGDGIPDFAVGARGSDRAVVFSGAVPPHSVAFCNGDGGATPGCTPCPCGNDAPGGTSGGCRNSAGTSARPHVSGNPGLAADTLRFRLAGANPGALAVLASAQNLLPQMGACPPGSGSASAVSDGLRCIGGNLIRHGARACDASGSAGFATSGWGPPNGPLGGILAQTGASAGQTRYFQAIDRELPGQICGSGQNASDAISVVLIP